MKLIKTLAFLVMSGLLFLSCGKELSEENGGGSGNAVGTLKADVSSGECLPSSVQGIFMAGTALNTNNFINVTVDITTVGAYAITSNIVNGYSFSGVGVATVTGIQTIRLNGTGTPTASGANTFTVSFGTSECDIVVNVLPAGTGAATYTLAGAGGACTGAVVAGTYTAGTAVTAANTVTIGVNVTAIGTYTISVPASNGITFSAAGAFAATGAQTVVLTAAGTPATAGTNNSTVTAGGGSCTFSVTTVGAGGGAAVFTLAGAGGTCTGAVVAGTYTAGTAVTAANTVTITVNVTTAGTYNISVPASNGISFAGTGTFAATGGQTVVLTASGTATTAGTNNSTVTAGGGSCTFSVTTVGGGGGGAAVFTLNGAGGTCTGATVAGTYTAGTAVTAANTVTLNVNVTTAGTYSISVPASNGITFSGSGTFAATGAQTVVLTAAGTPTAAGTNNSTVTVGAGSCTFSVTTVAGGPTDFLQCRIDGGAMQTFNVGVSAVYDDTDPTLTILDIYGESLSTSIDPALELGVGRINGGAINPGTYTVNQLAQNIVAGCYYWDAASNEYSVETDGTTITPGFTITITSRTATRVVGTFSGTVRLDGVGPQTRVLTEGSFSVPIQ